jgi:hypothetical protein
MHLIIDTVRPEHVAFLMPKGNVTVREAARILTEMANHSHIAPCGTPVVIDREMHLFVFKCIFVYFLQLLTIDRYLEGGDMRKQLEQAETPEDVPEVKFLNDGIFFNQAAHRRWTAIIAQPEHFQVVADFLRTVSPEEYGHWYFRIMQAAVRFKRSPKEGELRLLLNQLRNPHFVN